MPANEFQPLLVFLSAFGVSAFAGLAAQLRFGKHVDWIAIASSMLNTGLTGLAIALLWYNKFRDSQNIYGLIGICVLAGLAGMPATSFILQMLRKGGLSITITAEKDDELPDQPKG